MAQERKRSAAATPARRKSRRGGAAAGVTKGRLKVHDPFEVIRWLALSQSDPRKALAELVQNSLDAGARSIVVRRVRQKGVPCLRIWDDGDGVIPELDRAEALRYVATHIGHSRKRTLTPQQRLELMTQGQYGIGLLGFWSLGETLEMRTSMPGQRAHRLILYRDRPDYLIEPLKGRLQFDERWTEIVVAGLHREALPALVGRRAATYLASELRGQLLGRRVDLVVEDRMSRGRAQKVIHVKPRLFLGERLEGLGPVEVSGQPPIRLEIYFAGGNGDDADTAPLAVYAGGTLVAESFTELATFDLDHPPWTDSRLTGLVDFPALQVAPGTRRGIVPDAVAGDFAVALRGAEEALAARLEEFEQRRAEELDRTLIKSLQRAFRGFYQQRPKFAFLPVEARAGEAGEAGRGAVAESGAESPVPGEPLAPPPDLLPSGPLAEVRLTPAVVRMECGGRARARARASDVSGRAVDGPVTYQWRLSGSVGRLKILADPSRVELSAGAEPAEGTLAVEARVGKLIAGAEVPVAVVEELPPSGTNEGIPEPELVDVPAASWRSRLVDGRWQVNTGHREYREIADRPALKLRYLAMLFAKEVVLRSSQDPRLESPLEQLVEVAAYADRQLAGRRPRGKS
ncbi:MAG: ATP-binding protein [Thermoanaerobaculia bacterium]